MSFLRLVTVGLLALSRGIWAETIELKPGSALEPNLVKGKTNLVEFYADW